MITYLPKDSYQRMPWKNCKGITSQISIGPEGASFPGKFSWRVSSVEVNSNDPFSQFEGCQRLLMITKGNGLLLSGRKLNHGEVIHFSGEESIDAELVEGPVVDLGVIYRPDQVSAEMKVLDLSQNSKLNLKDGIHFIYCLHGRLDLNDILVHAEDTVRIEGAMNLELDGLNHSVYVLISIFQNQ